MVIKQAQNFTDEDTIMLVYLIDNHKPIGYQGWLALEKEYNKWAKTNSSVLSSLLIKLEKNLLEMKNNLYYILEFSASIINAFRKVALFQSIIMTPDFPIFLIRETKTS